MYLYIVHKNTMDNNNNQTEIKNMMHYVSTTSTASERFSCRIMKHEY